MVNKVLLKIVTSIELEIYPSLIVILVLQTGLN